MAKKRVHDEAAQATIGEAAFKYPDYGYRRIYHICRLRWSTPVSMAQVRASLRALRKERDDAFALIPEPVECPHWVRTCKDGVATCDKCGKLL